MSDHCFDEAPEEKHPQSYTYKLTTEQQNLLIDILKQGNFKEVAVPYTRFAVKGDKVNINIYTSGKCLIQGKNAYDFIIFTLEPYITQCATVGYEEELDPLSVAPHMGTDESGKGDFFGPLVIAAAYVNPELAKALKKAGLKDCKLLSDKQTQALAAQARQILTPTNYTIVQIGPAAYNKLYTKILNINNLLAWGHARAIENLLETVPSCPRAVADQFGRTKSVITRALMKKGQSIQLDQMHKAESDIAVATASVLARDAFLYQLKKLGEKVGLELPKGAGANAPLVAEALTRKIGPENLVNYIKCHFKTTDKVLANCGCTRAQLGEFGQATSRAFGAKQ